MNKTHLLVLILFALSPIDGSKYVVFVSAVHDNFHVIDRWEAPERQTNLTRTTVDTLQNMFMKY